MGASCCKLQRCRGGEGRSSLSSRYRVGVRPGKLPPPCQQGIEASWKMVKPVENGDQEQMTKKSASPSPVHQLSLALGKPSTSSSNVCIPLENLGRHDEGDKSDQGWPSVDDKCYRSGRCAQRSASDSGGLRSRRRRLERQAEEQDSCHEAFWSPDSKMEWTIDQPESEESFWIPDSLASHMGLERHRRVCTESQNTEEDGDHNLLHEVMQLYNSPREDVSQPEKVMSSKKDNWVDEKDQLEADTSRNLVSLDPATHTNATIFVEDALEGNCIS